MTWPRVRFSSITMMMWRTAGATAGVWPHSGTRPAGEDQVTAVTAANGVASLSYTGATRGARNPRRGASLLPVEMNGIEPSASSMPFPPQVKHRDFTAH